MNYHTRTFLLGLNLIAIYLFWPQEIFKLLGVIIVLFSVVALTWTNRSSLLVRRKWLNWLTLLGDTLRVSVHYLRLNRRYLGLSALGLMIAVAGVTQAIVIINIQEASLLGNTLSSPEAPATLFLSMYTPDPPGPYSEKNATYAELFGTLHAVHEEARSASGFSYSFNRTSDIFVSREIGNYIYYDTALDSNFWPVTLLGMNYDSMLRTWGTYFNGTWPSKLGEIVVLKSSEPLPDVQPNFYPGMNFSVFTSDVLSFPNDPTYSALNQTYNISGVIELGFPHFFPVIPWAANLLLSPIVMIAPVEFAVQMWNDLGKLVPAVAYSLFYYNYGRVQAPQLREDLVDLLGEASTLIEETEIPSFSPLSTRSLLAEEIWWIADVIRPLSAIYLFLSIPIIGISFFLVDLSFNLIESRKRMIIGQLKSRGASHDQIITAVFLEIIISSIIGLIGGVLLGAPLGAIVLNSKGFLRFSSIDYLPFFYPDQVLKLVFIGLILGVDYNLSNLLEAASTKIESSIVPIEIRKPFWRKYHLDLFLFIIGLALTYFLKNLSQSPNARSEELIIYLGAIGFFGVTVGAVMFLSWNFGSYLRPIGKAMWETTGSFFSFVIKTLSQRRMTTSKVVALIIATSLFTTYLISAPLTIENYSIEKQRYEIGSDISFIGLNFIDRPNYRSVLGMDNVTGYTELTKLFFKGTINSETYTIMLLAINTSSFEQIAHFKREYASTPLSEMVERLKSPGSILFWEKTMQQYPELRLPIFRLDIKDPYYENTILSLNIRNVGSFDYWPNLVTEEISKSIVLAVTSLDNLLPLYYHRSNPLRPITDFIVYAKVKPGLSIPKVATHLRDISFNKLGYGQMRYVGQTFLASQEAVIISLNVLINLGFLFSAITGLLTVMIYASLTVSERKREISLFRALGATRLQLFKLFLTELFLIFLISIPFGAFVAYLALNASSAILISQGFGGRYPPLTLIYPIRMISSALVLLFTIGLSSSVVPAILYARVRPEELSED